jgi:hypothetical protein
MFEPHPAIRILSKSEFKSELEKSPFVLLRDGAAIANCSDYEMITPDGRRYGLFCRGGESLLHFLQAMDILVTNKDRAMLAKVEGMIVEAGAEEPPQIYEDFDSLVRAWLSLHILYGVSISDEEWDALNCSEEYQALLNDPGRDGSGTVH